jgi:hypothetical protein
VLDIPLTYVKDMIVYNSQVIGGYDFGSTPMFFSIDAWFQSGPSCARPLKMRQPLDKGGS